MAEMCRVSTVFSAAQLLQWQLIAMGVRTNFECKRVKEMLFF